jgi:GT2 family glycosyltransferase
MKPVASVILTTRNRVPSLQRCLDSLRLCNVPADWDVEALVVDNGCSNDTKRVVETQDSQSPRMRFRYLCEPRKGKTYAVNCGTAAAKGEVCAFLDDDVMVDRTWLVAMLAEFQNDPTVGLIAGRVEPTGDEPVTVAVTRSVEHVPLNGLLTLEGRILGCNLAIRSTVLDKVKGRDTRLGPGRGLSCEDIDFTYRVLRSGYRGVFSPLPVVYHDPGERDRRREYLRGWGAFYIKFILSGDLGIAKQAWWKVRSILKDCKAGGEARHASLRDVSHMLRGASVMLTRMVLCRSAYK